MNSRSQSAPATTVSTCQCQSTGAKGPHLETESLVNVVWVSSLKGESAEKKLSYADIYNLKQFDCQCRLSTSSIKFGRQEIKKLSKFLVYPVSLALVSARMVGIVQYFHYP